MTFIGQGSPVKQGDEDDGIVSRREMRRRTENEENVGRTYIEKNVSYSNHCIIICLCLLFFLGGCEGEVV